QINYAICVLRALREGIRCKEIWIEEPTAIVILLRMSHRTLPRTGCAPIRHAINLSRARRLFLASSTPYRIDPSAVSEFLGGLKKIGVNCRYPKMRMRPVWHVPHHRYEAMLATPHRPGADRWGHQGWCASSSATLRMPRAISRNASS